MTVTTTGVGIELFDDRYIQDPYPLYDRMRAAGPVHRIGDSDFYAVCDWDAITDVVARPQDFSSNLTATMTYRDGRIVPFVMGELGGDMQALATADDPSHAVHRKLLLPHLSARRVTALRQFVLDTAQRLWDDAGPDGTVEWMSEMANRLPMMVVTRLIGVPDPDAEQLMQWGYASTKVVEGLADQDELTAAGVTVMELSGYVAEHFQRALDDPKDDLLSDLAAACAAGEISDIAALAMMITLFSAGGESTASLLGSAAHILATRPEIQRQLRENPELLGAFLEEVLRFESPFRSHYRHVLNDTTLCGVDVTADSRLLLLWGSANRDGSHFPRPNEFRLDRGAGKGHLSFGKGAHFCVGAALARLEARVVFELLLRQTTWIEAAEVGPWLPSLLVRRLERLELNLA
ncbi:cytochrome P450 [Mycolicibacterium sp. XJ1819]